MCNLPPYTLDEAGRLPHAWSGFDLPVVCQLYDVIQPLRFVHACTRVSVSSVAAGSISNEGRPDIFELGFVVLVSLDLFGNSSLAAVLNSSVVAAVGFDGYRTRRMPQLVCVRTQSAPRVKFEKYLVVGITPRRSLMLYLAGDGSIHEHSVNSEALQMIW